MNSPARTVAFLGIVVATGIGAYWVGRGRGPLWSLHRDHVEIIAVDGHKIEFMRYGSGSPTVVFLHGGFGGGPGLNSWAPWLRRVGTAAFCYSRPGSGNSEPAKDQRTPVQITDELHKLFGLVGIYPPYVFVGGSLGGLYSRAFAMRYPREVVGLVLVDGSHERQWLELNRLDPTGVPWPAPTDEGWGKADFAGLAATMKSGQLDVRGQLPDVPMAVITSLHHSKGKEAAPPQAEEVWRRLQSEIFQSTTYGIHIVTAKSGHGIANDEPALVLNAIRWVLDAARARAALRTNKTPDPTSPSGVGQL